MPRNTIYHADGHSVACHVGGGGYEFDIACPGQGCEARDPNHPGVCALRGYAGDVGMHEFMEWQDKNEDGSYTSAPLPVPFEWRWEGDGEDSELYWRALAP